MDIPATARRGRAVLWTLVALMAAIGLGRFLLPQDVFLRLVAITSPEYVAQELVLFQHPWTEGLHRLLGLTLLIAGMFQFDAGLRRRNPRVHRWTGRAFLLLALVVSLTGLTMGLLYPFAGTQEMVFIIVVSALMLFLISKAWTQARARNFTRHREWMIRALALSFFIAVMRVYTVPMNMLTDWPEPEVFISAGWMSVITVLAVAEWWINVTRGNLQTSPVTPANRSPSPT